MSNVYAATYYVSTTGSDSNSGMPAQQAWATFSHAVSRLSPGDELIILDGTYNQSLYVSRSGTSSNPISIRAMNDGKVFVDGRSSVRPCTISGSYIHINGIVFQNSSGSVVVVSGRYNEIKRCSAYNGRFGGNDHCWEITGTYNLLEDCIAAGTERHLFLSWSSRGIETHNTFRRCFAYGYRISSNSTSSRSAFNIYGASNDIIENCIAWGGHEYAAISIHSASWESTYRCDNNLVIGCIFMRAGDGDIADPGLGVFISASGGPVSPRNNAVKNCIIYDNNYGIRLSSTSNTIIENCTILSNHHYGISSENSSDIIKNTIIYNNNSGYSSTAGDFSYIDIYNNSSNNSIRSNWTNSISRDPLIDENILSIPIDSPCKNSGENNADIGANVLFQYENGVLTNKLLWPWPMENRINKELNINMMEQLAELVGSFSEDSSMSVKIDSNPVSGNIPLLVNFESLVSNGNAPYTFAWDFGDDSSSQEPNPSHTFTNAGNYQISLTVTDSDNQTASAATQIRAVDPENVLRINRVRFCETEDTNAVTQIEVDRWYDLYIDFVTPAGWNELSYADLWLHHSSNGTGNIENRGGNFSSINNYVLSYSVATPEIWVKESEGSDEWSNNTGHLGLYVDDDNNEYRISNAEGWARARIKLLPNAESGNWNINCYAVQSDRSISELFTDEITVINEIDNIPPNPPNNINAEFTSEN